jgi:hypothetical protein
MFPSTVDPSVGGGVAGGLLGLLFTGGLIWALFIIGLYMIGIFIVYMVLKTAIRNGIVEALRKTDNVGLGSSGGSPVSGYPPSQEGVGPPAAPSYSGYRGPNA